MPFFYFLLIIASLSCGSLPASDQPILPPVMATLGMVVACIMLCHLIARVTSLHVQSGECEAYEGARLLERQLDIFRWIGLGVTMLCLIGFGLGRVLHQIPVLEVSFFLKACVLLAPGLMIACGGWIAEHTYGVRLGYTAAGWGGYWRAVSGAFRSGMGWLIVPILVLLGVADLIGMLPVSPTVAGVLTGIVMLAGITLVFPWLIRFIFKTCPIDSETAAWLHQVLKGAGVTRTRIVGWDTGRRGFNAMVTGFVPPLRTLLISDRLIAEMPREELAMVVLHEAAHLRRRHVPLRMLSVLPAWFAASLVSQIAGDQAWAMPLGSAAGILFTLLILRSVAYRTEHDADVKSCEYAVKLASSVEHVPGSYQAAAETLARALRRVTAGHPGASRATWLHPSVDQRIALVRERNQPQANSEAVTTVANPA